MKQRSKPAAFLRGLICLAVLVALLVLVPYLLLQVGVLPHHVPSLDDVTTALTSPDDGQLFLGAITLIGWYGYLSFAASVLLELFSALRHRSAPRIKVLGGTQRLAGTLVGGIILLLPTSAAFAATTPATAASVAVTAPQTTGTPAAAATAHSAPATKAAPYTGPVHEVKQGESLWEIAEQRLGSGTRWHDIVTANEGVPQADGTVITADTAFLQPGWTLRLPADAKPAATPAPAEAGGARTQLDGARSGAPAATPATHTVKEGESLSSIAQDELGDAGAYQEIARLNQGTKQSDGRVLTDPNEIYPDWQLKLPAKTTPAPGAQHDKPAPENTPRPAPDGGQHQSPAPDGSKAPSASPEKEKPTHTPAPASGGEHTTPAPETPKAPPADAPSQAPAAPAAGQSEDAPVSVTTIAAATSLFAAAVLAGLGTRRALQQRRRRHKRRIPMPERNGAVDQLETQLRAVSDEPSLALLDRALRTLAANCSQYKRPLPEIDAVRVATTGIELHLSAPVPPLAPFTQHEEHPDRWWCPARTNDLLGDDDARDITAPYPALVSIGATETGEPVLINLEAAGVLRLHGSDDDVRAVIRAIAVELASGQLADDTSLLLSGTGAELEPLYPTRIEHHATLAEALPEMQAHDAFQRSALAEGELDSLHQARLAADGGDSWTPKILLATTAPAEQDASVLADLLSSRPRTAVAVVTAAADTLALPGAWTLPLGPTGPIQLPGLDLTVTVQRLHDDAYAPLVQLLATSQRTDDVPAPAWTNPPHAEEPAAAPAGPELTKKVAVTVRTVETSGISAISVPAPVPAGPSEDDGDSALAPAVSGTDAPPADELAPAPAPHEAESVEAAVEETARDEASAGADFDTALHEVLQESAERAEPADADAAALEPQASAPAQELDEEASALAPATLGEPETTSPVLAPAVVPQPADEEPAPAAAQAPRITAVSSNVLAALNTPPDPPAAPQIRVLGPVDIVGTLGKLEASRRHVLTEIAAWLVLHPGQVRQELDEAIWPGLRTSAGSRNAYISKLRTWLGRDPLLPADDPQAQYLPPIKEGIYRFNDQVTSDWHAFQNLYRHGMHDTGTEADIALAQALALVRGRPFSDIDQSRYVWAEHDIQEMISAGVDVAHELFERRLAARDFRAAASAATRGLTCDPSSEILYRDMFALYSETGDRVGMERIAHQLARIAAETGVDSSPETIALINALMDANRVASA
ncbi:LysM peptidoglycan-binding domain-containing protein [Streptomyces aureoversilis]|uniref:LysM peptidoglycan-binding domain-containing protein n=1 Tax=Streptomyces aureoversilis TaxID=67277 RepID=A0ABW0A5Y5_9ACTN